MELPLGRVAGGWVGRRGKMADAIELRNRGFAEFRIASLPRSVESASETLCRGHANSGRSITLRR